MSLDPLDRRETFNVQKAHEELLREKAASPAGSHAIPAWSLVLLWLLAFWVGGYLIRYHGGFRPDVFDETLDLDSLALSGPLKTADLAVLGKRSFSANCVACHQTTGLGVPNQYPPLVGSEFTLGPTDHLILIVLHGLEGPVKVKGETYNGAMPTWKDVLTDAQIAGILTYVRSSWGNEAGAVTVDQVKALREKYKERMNAWKSAELLAIPAEEAPPQAAPEAAGTEEKGKNGS